jgi:hypothetical protein
MQFLKENKKKLVRFIFAWFMVIFTTVAIVTLNTVFFDCKDDQCFVSVCADMVNSCDSDYNDCCIYESKEISFRDHLIAKLKLSTLGVGAGIGILVGLVYAEKGSKK